MGVASRTDPVHTPMEKGVLVPFLSLTGNSSCPTQISALNCTIYVVDRDVSVREPLAALIEVAGWRPETFAAVDEFLACPRSTVPCCVVADIAPPVFDGLRLQQRLADRPEMPMVFITGCGDVAAAVRAMKAGAVDVLMKPLRSDVVMAAIRDAIERSRAALTHQAQMQTLHGRYASLTPREREVMALVVSGLLNKQAGGELGISETTVKAHRGSLMRKMVADSLPDLVTMATRLGVRRVERTTPFSRLEVPPPEWRHAAPPCPR